MKIRDHFATGRQGGETVQHEWRGTLYPTRLPELHRELPPADLTGVVRWFWIPEWQLAPGRVSRQDLLPFPASNLTIQPSRIGLSGPATGRSHRDLRGRGWAVGALLRPAAVPVLVGDPRSIRDTEVPFDAPELLSAVAEAMSSKTDASARRARAIGLYADWLRNRVPALDADGELANRMEDVIASEPSVIRVEHVAQHLGISMRAVQRLARRHVGLTPLAMIRRYRLQEAAQRLRDDKSPTVAQVAAELGYADQAHLAADFRAVLGFTPSGYRRTADSGAP